MDVGALAGGDGGPRRVDSVEGGLEIVPLEMYDSARAKIEANLRWLFSKAYGEGKRISRLVLSNLSTSVCVQGWLYS